MKPKYPSLSIPPKEVIQKFFDGNIPVRERVDAWLEWLDNHQCKQVTPFSVYKMNVKDQESDQEVHDAGT